MVGSMRQLISKGDPRLNVVIPKIIKSALQDAAKVGKRRPQDEIIKRLAATMKYEESYNTLKGMIATQLKN